MCGREQIGWSHVAEGGGHSGGALGRHHGFRHRGAVSHHPRRNRGCEGRVQGHVRRLPASRVHGHHEWCSHCGGPKARQLRLLHWLRLLYLLLQGLPHRHGSRRCYSQDPATVQLWPCWPRNHVTFLTSTSSGHLTQIHNITLPVHMPLYTFILFPTLHKFLKHP